MNKSYKKLIIFESILFITFLLNMFIYKFLNGYTLIVFLFISLFSFKFILGIEKDRHRYIKDIIFEVLIFLLGFFLVYYLSGLLLGFVENKIYYNWNGLINFIIPTIIKVILIELLRYSTLVKSQNNKLLIILNVMLFFLIDVSTIRNIPRMNSSYTIFIFLASNVLPLISKNIVASYVSLKLGYKPFMIYSLVMELYTLVLPIIPKLSMYFYSLIMLLLPVLLWIRISKNFEKVEDKEIDRNYKKKRVIAYVIPTFVIIAAVYLTCGYFRYTIVAIGSGSMEPLIYKGDSVIIKKIDDYKELEIGQIIAFKHDGITVVHRIYSINESGGYYFQTKGDANKNVDEFIVEPKDVLGVVNYKIPYIGIPTIWLNEK